MTLTFFDSSKNAELVGRLFRLMIDELEVKPIAEVLGLEGDDDE